MDIDSILDELERLEELSKSSKLNTANINETEINAAISKQEQILLEKEVEEKENENRIIDDLSFNDNLLKFDNKKSNKDNEQILKLDKLKADISKLYASINLSSHKIIENKNEKLQEISEFNNEKKNDSLLLLNEKLDKNENKNENKCDLILLNENVNSLSEEVNYHEEIDLMNEMINKLENDEKLLINVEDKLDNNFEMPFIKPKIIDENILINQENNYDENECKNEVIEGSLDEQNKIGQQNDYLETKIEIDELIKNENNDVKTAAIESSNQHECVIKANYVDEKSNNNFIQNEKFIHKQEEKNENLHKNYDLNLNVINLENVVEGFIKDCSNEININELVIDVNEIHIPGEMDDLLNNLKTDQNAIQTNDNLVSFNAQNANNVVEKNEKLIDIEDDNSKLIINNVDESDKPITNTSITESESKFVINNQKSRELEDLKTQLNAYSDDQKTLGIISPNWIPDSEVDECMKCNNKFTFTKRRHHCRGCGFLFCANCCNLRLILQYNPKEQSRVCNLCYDTIQKINNLKKKIEEAAARPESSIVSVLKKEGKRRTSEISQQKSNDDSNENHQNIDSNIVGAVASVTSVTKSVRFSDGIAPGCDLAEDEDNERNQNNHQNSNATSSLVRPLNLNNASAVQKLIKSKNKKYRNKTLNSKLLSLQLKIYEQELINKLKFNLIQNNTFLPSLHYKDYLLDGSTDENKLLEKIRSSNCAPVTFILLKNLKVHVKIVNLENYVNACWLVITQGFCTIGQDELVYIIECYNDTEDLNNDKIPKQLFIHILDIYSKVTKGELITSMSYSLYQSSNNDTNDKNQFLDNNDNAGFIYFMPSQYNSLKNISSILPTEPFLIGLLIQKWEIPWAKLFPLRLLLLLGAESKIFPFPIVSSRLRKAYCGEIGHTIMNLLCDLRNYQYTITQINGLYITIENNQVSIQIPESQYNLIMKSILTSNDYVFSVASLNINQNCTSHLVAIENDNSNSYTSRKNSILDLKIENDLTGAAFIVFNGSLKSAVNPTINAKISIVEDGVMIQIDSETIEKLKQSLQAMKPFRIECNKTNESPIKQQLQQQQQQQQQQIEIISIEWYKGDTFINTNVTSPIDSKSMCGIRSIRLYNNTFDYINDSKLIRLTEIFPIRIIEDTTSVIDSNFNVNRFVDSCSQSFCFAIITLLDDLVNETSLLINNNLSIQNKNSNDDLNSFFKLALRITVNRDVVEYQIGTNGIQITDEKYLSCLDNELIPLLHQANQYNIDICLEFIFYILDQYNIDTNKDSNTHQTISTNANEDTTY